MFPFEGKRYQENKERCRGGETPCAYCGKPCTNWDYSVVVINGGSDWGTEESDPDDSGYMGSWPVGTDCARKLKKAGVTVYKKEKRDV